MPRLKMKTIFKTLFAPVLWLLQSCSPLGSHVDKELSDNHYYNNSKTKIIYSSMGNWFELGKTEMEADVKSFEVFNRFLSKDKDRIYFKEYPAGDGETDLSSFYVKREIILIMLALTKIMFLTLKKSIRTKPII